MFSIISTARSFAGRAVPDTDWVVPEVPVDRAFAIESSICGIHNRDKKI